MKSITAILILAWALAGCQALDSKSTYEVDTKHLIRSALYTQQELLKLELTASPKKDPQRYDVLINNYCDLIDRGYINASKKSELCYSYTAKINQPDKKHNDKRYCATVFHRCFNQCSLSNNECMRCEEKASRCLH